MGFSADILIVGAGVVGCSVAYHLKNDGFEGRVLVLERDPGYQFASSALAMGGVRQQFTAPVNVRMVQFSLATYEAHPEFQFRQRGYLFLGNAGNWEKLRRQFDAERAAGAQAELLTIREVRQKVPELRCDDLVGAIFGARDGYVDPRATLHFLRNQAERAGAIFMSDEVAAIETADDSIEAVQTIKAGRIETHALVIASGAYSAQLGAMAGIDLPVTPVRQQLFRCELPRRWSYEFPMVVDPGGVHWRSYGENEVVIAKTNPEEPPGIRFGGDMERFYDDVLPDLICRLPEFRDLKLVFAWGGLYEMTPDHNGIIDQHPEIHGLYMACGFSGHGLMMAPATGKLTSELIRTGRFMTLDASPLSYGRFARNELFFDDAMI